MILTGEVSNIGDYYHQALALLHPARFEGMPNVVLEAMATGTPVVVSNSQSSILDLMTSATSALVADTDNVNQLTQIIKQLNADPIFRKRLGHGAKAAVAERLLDDGVTHWVDIIALVTDKHMKGGL